MARTLDQKLFIQHLLELPQENLPEPPEEIQYLMDHIVAPLLDDQFVSLQELDFDQFDEERLDQLEEYVDWRGNGAGPLYALAGDVQKLPSACRMSPSFC